MNAHVVIIWTCVLVFIATAVITLLALTGKIQLGGGRGRQHNYYLRRLFGALILEIVASAVAIFALHQPHSMFVPSPPPSDDPLVKSVLSEAAVKLIPFEQEVRGVDFDAARSGRVFHSRIPDYPDVVVGLEPKPNDYLCSASYDFDPPRAGRYLLQIRYAGLEDRGVGIRVNDQTVSKVFSLPPNGGWGTSHQAWSQKLSVDLKAGKNQVTLVREGAFPHISALKIVEDVL